ncbi:MAG: type VI secretion system protein TssA [Acidobacteria bacterium]|nr:type VI secretion system protein TssA [Acidobacteriota bacterium]
MAEIEPKPSVINLEALLAPISEDKPAGEYLRYSGIYDEISEARRADDNLNQGEWQTELKFADYRKVIALAVPALEKETKDLQIAAWLSEALVKEHGWVGLRDSLRMIAGLQETFWETLHPEVDEGDMEGRANAVAWMEQQASFALKQAKITGYAGYSFIDWEDSKHFDIPDNLETYDSAVQQKYNELRAQAERENRVTANKWRAEMSQTRRVFYEELNFLIEECWAAFRDLDRIIEEKYDRNQAPGMNNLKKSLDAVHTQIKKFLEDKRAEEPDEVEETVEEEVVGEDGTVVRVAGPAVATGAIQNRQDALKRLADIADYFKKNEPHSPISYLVSRAVKWGNMPLENWLQDVIKDETVIFNIRQTLGFNTNLPESSE